MVRKDVDNTPAWLCPDPDSFHFTFDFASYKSGKLCRQFPESMSFLAPSQTPPQANFKDDVSCGSICCFKIHSFNVVVTRGYKVFSMII